MASTHRIPRWAFAVAALALAALACDPPPATGITCLYEQEDGSIIAPQELDYFDTFISMDGGLSWQVTESVDYFAHCSRPSGVYGRDHSWIATDPTNPNILYRLTPALSIERSENAGRSWIKEIDLSGTEARTVYYLQRNIREAFEFRPGPLDVLFHSKTGNVVLAMSYEGVLVRTPERGWEWVGVGPYYRQDMRDLSVTLPLIGEELLIALQLGLLTTSTMILLFNSKALRALLATVLIAVFTTPILFFGTMALFSLTRVVNIRVPDGLSSLMFLLSLIAPILLAVLIIYRTRNIDRLSFVPLAVGWTFFIFNWIRVAVSFISFAFTSPILSYILFAILLALCGFILYRLRASISKISGLATISGGIAALIVAVCYFLWGIGGIPFFTEATIFAALLALVYLLLCATFFRRLGGKANHIADKPQFDSSH